MMANEGVSRTPVLRHGAVQLSWKSEGTHLGPRLAAIIVEALSDEFSRKILSTSVLQGKTVEEICDEQGIPPSSCYRRMRRLVDEGVMVVERMVVASTGRKYAIYRSAFSCLHIRLEDGVVSVYATLNPAVADKLRTRSRLRESTAVPIDSCRPSSCNQAAVPKP